MKAVKILILLLLICLIMSCQKRINGKYVARGQSLVDSVEFKGGRAYFTTGGILGRNMKTPGYKYRVEKNTIYITDPKKGDVPFEIINDNTIKCETFGLSGTFVKKSINNRKLKTVSKMNHIDIYSFSSYYEIFRQLDYGIKEIKTIYYNIEENMKRESNTYAFDRNGNCKRGDFGRYYIGKYDSSGKLVELILDDMEEKLVFSYDKNKNIIKYHEEDLDDGDIEYYEIKHIYKDNKLAVSEVYSLEYDSIEYKILYEYDEKDRIKKITKDHQLWHDIYDISYYN